MGCWHERRKVNRLSTIELIESLDHRVDRMADSDLDLHVHTVLVSNAA